MRVCAAILIALALSSCTKDSPEEPFGALLLTFTRPDTSRTASLRYYANTRVAAPEVVFGPVAAGGSRAKDAARALPSVREIEGAGRFVYAFELEGLEPETEYEVLLSGPDGPLLPPRRFLTLPSTEAPLRLLVGGDLGPGEAPRQMAKAAALFRPDVLLLGGDLAYDNGLPENAPRWDALLTLLDEDFTDEQGRMTPVIAAIGNHEVRWSFGRPHPRHAPFYFALFSDLRDPDLVEETYFERRLGALVRLFVLDTGHIASHAGLQRMWLERALSASLDAPFRLALYHVPLYPSVRPFDDEASAEGRAQWAPLFDRFELAAAFEHHDHALKRTFPLKRGRIVEEGGTLYLGDGAFGRPTREPAARLPYVEKVAPAQHAWVVDVTPKALRFRAIGPTGEVLDEAWRAREAPAQRPTRPRETEQVVDR